MAATMITPAALAAELGTDARTTRKFLRSITPREEHPGKGSRWEIKGTKTNINSLRKQFTSWNEAQEEARQKRAEEKAKRAEGATDESLDEDEEPTAEALAEIEDEED